MNIICKSHDFDLLPHLSFKNFVVFIFILLEGAFLSYMDQIDLASYINMLAQSYTQQSHLVFHHMYN